MDASHFIFWICTEFLVCFFGGIGIYVRLMTRIKVLEVQAEAKDKELTRVWATIKDVAAEAGKREEKILVKLDEIAKSITGIQIDAARNSHP